MRLFEIFIIIKIYYYYFVREVIGMSIIKDKVIKLYLFFMGTITYFSLILAVHFFITNSGMKVEHVHFLLDSYALTIISYTVLIFIIIKYFFLLNTGIEQKMRIFPVTNREVKISSFMLETLIFTIGISLISLIMVLPMFISYQFSILIPYITNVIMNSFSMYLSLHLLYNVLQLPFKEQKTKQFFPIFFVIVAITSMILLTNYNSKIIMDMSINFLNNIEKAYMFLLWKNLNIITNIFITLLIFIAYCIFTTYLIMKTTSNKVLVNYHYLNIKVPKYNYLFCLVKQLIRKTSNIINIIIYYLLFISFVFVGYSSVALVPLIAISSLYAFSNTTSLRQYKFSVSNSTLREYIYLFTSQVIYGFIMLAPSFLYYLVYRNFSGIGVMIVIYLCSVMIMLMLGILFPSKEENPLTPLLSFTVLILLTLFIILFISILQLTTFELYIATFITIIFIVLISNFGLKKIMLEGRK